MIKNYSLTIFLTNLLLLVGNAVFATHSNADSLIHVSTQTAVFGFDNIHIEAATSKNALDFNQNALIFVSANTVFSAPDQLIQQLVIFNPLPQSLKRITNKTTASKNIEPKTQAAKNPLPLPLDSIPSKNTTNYCLAASNTILTSQTKNLAKALASLPKLCDYLIEIPHNKNLNTSYVENRKENLFSLLHTTRPPPVQSQASQS